MSVKSRIADVEKKLGIDQKQIIVVTVPVGDDEEEERSKYIQNHKLSADEIGTTIFVPDY